MPTVTRLLFVIIAFTGCGKTAVVPPVADAAAVASPLDVASVEAHGADDDAKPADDVTRAEDAKPAADVTAESDDLLVWTTSTTGRETLWVHGDEVIAKRAEAIVAADGRLWALGEEWRTLAVRPCDESSRQADAKARIAKVLVPRLVAKALGGDASFVVLDPAADVVAWDGDISGDVTLAGNIGPLVFAYGGSDFYACGAAHPDGDSDECAFRRW